MIGGGANIYLHGAWAPLLPSGGPAGDFIYSNTVGNDFKTWYGVKLWMQGYTVKFRIPDFYINNVVGICGTNDFDITDEFRLNDGTIIAPDIVDNSVNQLGVTGYKRSDQESQCAASWKIGKLNKIAQRPEINIKV